MDLENISIEFGSSLEEIAVVFQKATKFIVTVVNDKTVQFFERGESPGNLEFVMKTIKNRLTHFYFSDGTNTYCVIGTKNARTFVPNLDVDQSVQLKREDNEIIVVDNGKAITFNYYADNVEITKHR